MRTKRSALNSISSLLYFLTTIIVGIINRKVLIDILGIEYQGVNGLFANILSMLSIAELGLGTAIVYNLYEPIKSEDRKIIVSLMDFYRKCYLIVAVSIFVIGLLLAPILPHVVKNYNLQYPIEYIYFLFLLDTVLSYILSYRRSILIADQKNYIIFIFDGLTFIVYRILQISVLILTHDFILYLICMIAFRVIGNIAIHIYTNKTYSFLNIKIKEKLDPGIFADIKLKVKGALFHKIGTFIVLGTDNILISKFFGLVSNGVYSNYSMLINTLQSIISMSLSSITSSIGNLLLEKDQDNIFEVFKETRVLNFILSCVATAGIYCLASPIIRLFFGDQYVLDELTVFVLAFNFSLQSMRGTYSMFKEAAGILYEDRFVPIIESLTNIIASIILLRYFGLAGIFMGTIVSTLILFCYSYPRYVYGRIIKQKIFGYWVDLIWEILVIIIAMFAAKIISNSIMLDIEIVEIIVRIIIVSAVALTIAFFGYLIWRKESRVLFDRLKRLLIAA